MRKDTFIAVMIIEFMAALISMGLLFSDVGALIYPISLAVFAAVLSPFYLWMRKTTDEEKKKKIRIGMVCIMLLPIAAGVITFLSVVVVLAIYFM